MPSIKFSREQILALRNSGKTLKAIADEVGCCLGTVANVLRKINGNQGSVGRKAIFSHEAIVAKYNEQAQSGKPNLKKIADDMGCSYGTIRNVVTKAGLIEAKTRAKVQPIEPENKWMFLPW